MNILGVDHGNESIKTPYTVFTAGLGMYNHIPPMTSEWIMYDGKYYSLSKTPQVYAKDKTKNLNYFIYTLFALCREEKNNTITFKEPVDLAIGLPPLYMASLKSGFENYFRSNFGNECKCIYCEKEKTIHINRIVVYPQGYAAAYAYHTWTKANGKVEVKSNILNKYRRYLVIDIGGVTVDYIYFDDNIPVLDKCDTRETGMNNMAEDMIAKIQLEFGYSLTRKDISEVTNGEPSILPVEIKNYIFSCCDDWADKIITDAQNKVGDLRTIPCVFMGGGSGQLENSLIKSPLYPPYAEIIPDQKANAYGFSKLMKDQFAKR